MYNHTVILRAGENLTPAQQQAVIEDLGGCNTLEIDPNATYQDIYSALMDVISGLPDTEGCTFVIPPSRDSQFDLLCAKVAAHIVKSSWYYDEPHKVSFYVLLNCKGEWMLV